MSLFDPFNSPGDLDESGLEALEGLSDEELLELLEGDPEAEPDEPRGRPVVDVDIPIDNYPPARTEGDDPS